jgi:phosphatidylserine/phosphatidylglycerophosphate/cardiolipin synthase-like enzyme
MHSKAEQYSGSESFRYIDRLISNKDSELLIISPYISNYYTRMLLKRKRKKVRIITSESSISKDKLLSNPAKSRRRSYAKAIAYFAVLGIILLCINAQIPALAVLAFTALLVLGLIKNMLRGSSSNISVKTTGSLLIHEKMYIGKAIAITGSANLTYNGTHKNIEHIEIITNQDLINELRAHFEELWRAY